MSAIMTFIEAFLDIIGMLLILIGIVGYVIEIIGVFRFDYVLNRMHATAIGDSLALLCALTGAGLIIRDWFAAGKLLLILVMVYLTSPLAGHMIARTEAMTNNHLEAYLDKPITEKNHTLKGVPYGKH